MKLYQVRDHLDGLVGFAATREDARSLLPLAGRVEEISIAANAAQIARLLQHATDGNPDHGAEVTRTWRLGPRGGLVACANGE